MLQRKANFLKRFNSAYLFCHPLSRWPILLSLIPTGEYDLVQPGANAAGTDGRKAIPSEGGGEPEGLTCSQG
jgi:hypothetical protein